MAMVADGFRAGAFFAGALGAASTRLTPSAVHAAAAPPATRKALRDMGRAIPGGGAMASLARLAAHSCRTTSAVTPRRRATA
jgi:hypothetical protein